MFIDKTPQSPLLMAECIWLFFINCITKH